MIKFVKGRLNFSCKSTTATNVDLTESLLDNWLKNVLKPAEKQNPVATRSLKLDLSE